MTDILPEVLRVEDYKYYNILGEDSHTPPGH